MTINDDDDVKVHDLRVENQQLRTEMAGNTTLAHVQLMHGQLEYVLHMLEYA